LQENSDGDPIAELHETAQGFRIEVKVMGI